MDMLPAGSSCKVERGEGVAGSGAGGWLLKNRRGIFRIFGRSGFVEFNGFVILVLLKLGIFFLNGRRTVILFLIYRKNGVLRKYLIVVVGE